MQFANYPIPSNLTTKLVKLVTASADLNTFSTPSSYENNREKTATLTLISNALSTPEGMMQDQHCA